MLRPMKKQCIFLGRKIEEQNDALANDFDVETNTRRKLSV